MTKLDLFSLKEKVALITGGSRGIGFAIATEMAKQGAIIIICSENQNDLDEAVKNATDDGISLNSYLCDVTSFAAQNEMVSYIIKEFGRLDILVCNAGITGKAGSFADLDFTDYDRVMEINLKANVHLCNLALPYIAVNQGSVILISSLSGLRGNARINTYSLTKAAMAQLARNLAVEWGPKGVNVNTVSPGFIKTPLSEPLINNPEFMAKRMAMTPLRRVGEVQEIAGACVFLAAPAGAFVNGHNLVVDGGTIITDGN
jgi:NAD(P)-dependent dehydrogenase (short-subunit alcohol dehydrogenase family)